MSIIITNIDDNPRQSGEHKYVLKINSNVICEFTHNREDGLSVCLEKAAKAANDQRWKQVIEMLELASAARKK